MFRDKKLTKFSTWTHILNVLLILILYGSLNESRHYLAPIVGTWGIFLLGYRIFWQYLGVSEFFNKREKNKNSKITKP